MMKKLLLGASFDMADGLLAVRASLPTNLGTLRLFCDNTFLGHFPAADLARGLTLTPAQLPGAPAIMRIEGTQRKVSAFGRVWHKSDAFRAWGVETFQGQPVPFRLLVLISGSRAPSPSLLTILGRTAELLGCDGLLDLRLQSAQYDTDASLKARVLVPWAVRVQCLLAAIGTDPEARAEAVLAILERLPAALVMPLDAEAEAILPWLRTRLPLLLRRPTPTLPDHSASLLLRRVPRHPQKPQLLQTTGLHLDLGDVERTGPAVRATLHFGAQWLGLGTSPPTIDPNFPRLTAAMFHEVLDQYPAELPRLLLHDGSKIAYDLASTSAWSGGVAAIRSVLTDAATVPLAPSTWGDRVVIYPGTDPEIDQLMYGMAHAGYLSVFSRRKPAAAYYYSTSTATVSELTVTKPTTSDGVIK